jgi:hypothetical protein
MPDAVLEIRLTIIIVASGLDACAIDPLGRRPTRRSAASRSSRSLYGVRPIVEDPFLAIGDAEVATHD